MDEIQNSIERLYSPGDVALHLNIERQTVTKYATLFEKNGYNFHKDIKGNRAYTDTNIMMFKDLITQRNKPGVTLEAAAKSLTAIYKKDPITLSVTNNVTHSEQDISVMMEAIKELTKEVAALREENQDIKEHLEKQESFNKALVEQLQQLDRGSIERHNYITQSLKETLETQKLLAAAAEESKQNEQTKKSFFARLFGR
jgi:predicted RNase H-like nuclease (RuvC/YqgF family)